jgi:hypothetical protein
MKNETINKDQKKQEDALNMALTRISEKRIPKINGTDLSIMLLQRLDLRSQENSRLLIELAKKEGIEGTLQSNPLPTPIRKKRRFKLFK